MERTSHREGSELILEDGTRVPIKPIESLNIQDVLLSQAKVGTRFRIATATRTIYLVVEQIMDTSRTTDAPS